jgi:hypothetical protein
LDVERTRLQDDDGMDRLARQRRNVRARSWVDAEGMWNLSATFDPVTGVRVAARIDAMVQAMFAETVPGECPSDPIEKQRYLAAHTVARLLLDEALDDSHTADDSFANTGSSGPTRPRPRPAKPEFVAVIDADTPGHTGPVAEFSIGVEIPARVLATLAGNADIHAVVVRNGIVLYAPDELNLRRTTRLANRAQRRAFAASTSAAPSPAAASPTTAANSPTPSTPVWSPGCVMSMRSPSNASPSLQEIVGPRREVDGALQDVGEDPAPG